MIQMCRNRYYIEGYKLVDEFMRDKNTNMWIRLWHGIMLVCGWNCDRE